MPSALSVSSQQPLNAARFGLDTFTRVWRQQRIVGNKSIGCQFQSRLSVQIKSNQTNFWFVHISLKSQLYQSFRTFRWFFPSSQQLPDGSEHVAASLKDHYIFRLYNLFPLWVWTGLMETCRVLNRWHSRVSLNVFSLADHQLSDTSAQILLRSRPWNDSSEPAQKVCPTRNNLTCQSFTYFITYFTWMCSYICFMRFQTQWKCKD